uniref:C40 family peptidase n=1 Tax=Stappia sp. TaxID=1870903 RepID=UPI003BA920A3
MTGTAELADLDRRRHPVRTDLAARAYEGRVDVPRFADGTLMHVTADLVDIRPVPDPCRSIDSQAIFGEQVTVFEVSEDGWAWGQLGTDGYVGYMPYSALGDTGETPTHRVTALRSYRYPSPELKSPPLGLLSLGARVAVIGETVVRGLTYALLADGSAMVARHLAPLGARVDDWVSVAEMFLGTPYLWGGRSSLGLDCSALIQLAAAEAGILVPRDSDMQAGETGDALPLEDFSKGNRRRGDLLFWKGHVGVLLSPDELLHANGHTMSVAREPVAEALSRISKVEWGALTGWRRLR